MILKLLDNLTLVPNGFISQQAGTMLYAKIGQLKQLTAVQVKITETATTATVLEVFEWKLANMYRYDDWTVIQKCI